MKTKLLLSAAASFLFYCFTSAQTSYTPEQWQQVKKEGKLDGKASATISNKNGTPNMEYKLAPNIPNVSATTNCQAWIPEDPSWQVAQFPFATPPYYSNDDGSTGLINLPFNFCFYGTTYTGCYINNNGNISFGGTYSTYSASGFPNINFVMIAPFWGDVDTQGPLSGCVHYQITPTHMVVHWDSVGYFSAHDNKLNTFQLVISNGSDPIIPNGNVSFDYKDMQWTTGDASGGSNGFGGSNAVVGANKGDGINYIQFGRFNQPGGTYNGPAGANSGIDWLDYKYFIFNACTNSNNVPPIASGIAICDTLHLCAGDTLPFNATFFSPEVAQTTVIIIDTTGTTGYHIVSNTSGNTAALNSYFVGSASNVGYNTLTISAADNGIPADTTKIPIVIEVSPAPITTIISDTTVCAGPVTLFATGGGTYNWLPSSGLSCTNCSNPVATPTVTTTYSVTISNGCTVHRVVTVYAPPVIVITPPTTICSGNSIPLNALGGTSYSWLPSGSLTNPNIANPVATPTVTTTYTVTVVNGNFAGCTRTATVTITVVATPIAVASNDTTICAYASANLVASGGATYSWSPAANLNNASIANPIATPPVTTTYIVTVSNGTCTDKDTVIVTVLPHLAIAGADTTICPGTSANLHASGGTIYSWSPATNLNNASIANPIATPPNTTTYVVTVSNGTCSDKDTVVVTVRIPIAAAGPDVTICAGTSTNLLATGGTIYSWSPATNLNNPSIANPVATPPITTSYVVTVSNGTCTDKDTVIITVQSPVAVAGLDTTICAGTSANLLASGGISYSWAPPTNLNNPSIANPVATPPNTTTYVVTVSDGTCTANDIVIVTVQSVLANAGPDTTVCIGDIAHLNATGGVSYSWAPTSGLNNPNIANPIATPTVTTTYTCTVTNAIGCTDMDIATVTINPLPIPLFVYSPAVIMSDSTYYFTDQSTGGATSWLWTFGDGNNSTQQNPSHFYNFAGTYHVCLVTTSNTGCVDSTCEDLVVLDRPLEAPNVFTPNNDGTNDALEFKNLEHYPYTMLQVYDRWGALVYQNVNYLNDWTGKKNGTGADCFEGTYYYILSGYLLKEPRTGCVELIRGK